MGQDDSGGVGLKRRLDHFAGVHTGAVDGAVKQFLKRNELMLAVEQYYRKDFSFLFSQLTAEIVLGDLWIAKAAVAPIVRRP